MVLRAGIVAFCPFSQCSLKVGSRVGVLQEFLVTRMSAANNNIVVCDAHMPPSFVPYAPRVDVLKKFFVGFEALRQRSWLWLVWQGRLSAALNAYRNAKLVHTTLASQDSGLPGGLQLAAVQSIS